MLSSGSGSLKQDVQVPFAYLVLFPLCPVCVLSEPVCPCLSVYVSVCFVARMLFCVLCSKEKKKVQTLPASHSTLDLVLTQFGEKTVFTDTTKLVNFFGVLRLQLRLFYGKKAIYIFFIFEEKNLCNCDYQLQKVTRCYSLEIRGRKN